MKILAAMLRFRWKAIKLWQCVINFYQHYFCLGICICLNKTNTYLARRKHRWQPSCESIRPWPTRNREETLQTQEDRYRTSNSIRDLTLVCYLGRDQVLHYVE